MKSLKKTSFWKKLSMPHAFTILTGILIFVGILTWVFSGFDTINADKEAVKVVASYPGDWITSIIGGFSSSLGVIMFLLILGAFINIVIQSGALGVFIGKLAGKFQTNLNIPQYNGGGFKEKINYNLKFLFETFKQTWIFIPLIFFFSFCGSTYGMAEESISFYAVIIPLALAAGFDVWTGFLIIFIGCGAGVMGSTINPFSVIKASTAAKVEIAGDASIADLGQAWRWVSWVFLTLFTCGYVMWYGMRVKINKQKSYVKDLFTIHEQTFQTVSKEKSASKMTIRNIITVSLFLLSFVLMALSMMFPSADTVPSMFGKGWAGIDNVAGEDLGPWWDVGKFYFAELFAFFFLMTLIIAIINWKGEKKLIDDIMTGGRDFLGVCYAVGIAASIGVILKKSNLQYYIVGKLANTINASTTGSETGNRLILSLVSYILFVPLTFFVPSTSGLAQASFPILGPAIADNTDSTVINSLPGVIHGYGMASGWANMFVPTYAVVVGALSVTKIGYGKFLRIIWKYLLMMFVLGLILLTLGSFFPLV